MQVVVVWRSDWTQFKYCTKRLIFFEKNQNLAINKTFSSSLLPNSVEYCVCTQLFRSLLQEHLHTSTCSFATIQFYRIKKCVWTAVFLLLLRPARTNTKQCDEERGAEETKQMKKGKREKNVVNSCKFYVHFLRIGDDFVVICFVPYMDFVDELMVYPMSSICISVPSVCAYIIFLFRCILLFCNCHFLPKNCVAIDAAFFLSSVEMKFNF